MKFFLTFTILSTFLSINAQQNQRVAFYDAIYLKQLYSTNNSVIVTDSSVREVLNYYFGKDSIALDTYIAKNVFLSPYIKASGAQGNVTFNSESSIAPSNFFHSLLNSPVTTAADGLAKFLVQRTKEELSVAFFEQLKKDFDDEKYAALQTLFSRTHHQLDLIGDKIYQFSSYLTELRSSFIADLNDITTSIPYVLQLPQFHAYFAKRPWVAGIIQMGFYISSELINHNNDSIKPLANILNEISDKSDSFFQSATPTATTIKGSIKTLDLISESLRYQDTSRSWITSNDFFKLITDDITFKIYLGLIYQRAKTINIVFDQGYHLTTMLDSIAPKVEAIQALKNSLSALMLQMNLFDEDLNILKKSDGSDKTSYYYALFNTSIDILLKGTNFIKNIDDKFHLRVPGNFFNKVNDYTLGLQDVSNIYLSINQKRYASAISATTHFFDIVFNDTSLKRKYVVKLIQKLSTYGTFIADVANANTSNGVDSIITQTVLPTGSSYIKKHSVFNIALQAYTGIYGGLQKQATDIKYVGATGIYAPVGLAVSWGFKNKKRILKNPGSFSLFASIIDLGPLVSFRFSHYNDTIANNINVRLSQIISPGLHMVFGLPKVPVSLGGGCNWAPLLTQIEKDQVNFNTKNAFRFQIFAAVDIPFLNFYNKPR